MRLTNKKTKIKLSDTKRYDLQDHKMFTKLSQLEDIEDELGIDLITLFKALNSGAWFSCKQDNIHFDLAKHLCELQDKDNPEYVYFFKEKYIKLIKNETDWWLLLYSDFPFRLRDYGKTWALTKEELE